ncbi:MAG: nucleotidyltransferase family protein [Deltaproteobacteria bacterium]|nr:nucleotidyltransferase family protein [Deltaproteobacteria bacterium]MBW2396122.1 nucleotidyltransferase family protein [Deltaproteobacteria bacterium]
MLANPRIGPPTEAGAVAFLLGGRRRGGDALAEAAGVSHKAQIPVAGIPMGLRVIRTLHASKHVAETWLCTDDPELAAHEEVARACGRGKIHVHPPAETPSGSVESLLSRLDRPRQVLVTTADHPLLEPRMVDHFIERASQCDADVVVGVVPEHIVREHYPDVRRTFVGLRDERITGANLFFLRTPRAVRAVAFWREMDAHRKHPWRLAARIGVGSLARLALGRLDLDAAVERISKRAGVRAEALRLPFPECALDVDRPEHLALAEQILQARANKSTGGDGVYKVDLGPRSGIGYPSKRGRP